MVVIIFSFKWKKKKKHSRNTDSISLDTYSKLQIVLHFTGMSKTKTKKKHSVFKPRPILIELILSDGDRQNVYANACAKKYQHEFHVRQSTFGVMLNKREKKIREKNNGIIEFWNFIGSFEHSHRFHWFYTLHVDRRVLYPFEFILPLNELIYCTCITISPSISRFDRHLSTSTAKNAFHCFVLFIIYVPNENEMKWKYPIYSKQRRRHA